VGLWDLARSDLDPWALAALVGRAGRADQGAQADRVVLAGRAVQEGPVALAVQLGRARRAQAGPGVRDAPVRVVDELRDNEGVQARSAGWNWTLDGRLAWRVLLATGVGAIAGPQLDHGSAAGMAEPRRRGGGPIIDDQAGTAD